MGSYCSHGDAENAKENNNDFTTKGAKKKPED